MNAPNFNNSIEITKEAFVLLVGNDERSWRDFENNDHAEWITYFANGVTLMSVHNFIGKVTQYYVQDINA